MKNLIKTFWRVLTEFLDLCIHLRVADQGQERGLNWSDRWWESKVSSLGIGLTLSETVLKYTVDDTSNTE